MSKAGAITTYIIRKLWTLIAISLVVVALLMSLLRYSLPYLDNYKDQVESYISQQYSVDLSIGELSANWQRSGPALVLREVSIQKGEQSPIALDIGEVYVSIEFWPSIATQKLQSSQVSLSRLNIDIDLEQIETSESDFPILSALENIFLEQLSQFAVSESKVMINSALNSKTINIEQLSWLNQDNRHQGVGEFALQDFSDNNATFIVDLFGDVSSYSGTLYAQATDLNLSAWFNEFTGLENQLASSQGNFKVWARINDSRIERIDGKILPTTFDWNTKGSILRNSLAGNFAAQAQDNAWNFSLPEFTIEVNNKETKIDLLGRFSFDEGWQINTGSSTDLSNLVPMVSLYSLSLADSLILNEFQLSLDEFALKLSSNTPTISAQISNLGWNERDEWVGINGLSSRVQWHGKKGKIDFIADNTILAANYLFDREVQVSFIDVPLYFDFDLNNKVSIVDAEILADGLSLNADVDYSLQNQFLSLALDIGALKASKVPSLLPNHLMGQGAKSFLTRALAGKGQIEEAKVLWHGSIGAYPFADNTGVFQSRVEISDADFVFSNEWPAINDLDIVLSFENKSLSMAGSSAYLDKVELSDLRAQIPSLSGNSMLSINAQGVADSKDVTRLMLQSSLANSLGSLLDTKVLVNGALSTDLLIEVPLDKPASTRASGKVEFSDNQINLPTLKLALDKATGTLTFDNELIQAEGLSAQLLGQDILVDLSGEQVDRTYSLDVNATGNWDVEPLVTKVGDDFSRYFAGTSAWNLDLHADLLGDSFEYEARLNSNLAGISAALPEPFAKLSNEQNSFSLLAKGDNLASSVEITLDDKLRFDGAVAHKEKQFNRAHLALGPTEFESRGVGFSISADFQSMQFSQWYPFIRSLTSNNYSGQTTFLGLPQRIFVKTDSLLMAGQSFSDVDLTVKRLDDQWSLDLDADQTRGQITVFDDWYGRGVLADLAYIRIPKKESFKGAGKVSGTEQTEADSEGQNLKVTIDPKTLPSLNLTCRSCEVYGNDLGRVELEAEPNDDGLELTRILVDNEKGKVNASGQWYKRNQDHFTFVAGALSSQNFGQFLTELGLDTGIQDSQADMSFALTWKDSPFDAKFENLDGEVEWQLSDGYLTEVSDQGSRIFTLLSLNSLVRKLSLDFRDVFAKGFFYDDMGGSIQITQGKADTRDTNIDGAAGEIEIYGYTDLVSKELNYNVSFTPNVTGNLPVLVYFFTVSPPSALAALALDQVLTSAKVISNVNYSVTGTIAQPVLIETGRESTDVELPARREAVPEENLSPFIPPSEDDLIKIEVDDGQSD